MLAILDFIHNAVSKLPSGHSNKSGIPVKPNTDTEIVNLLLLFRKLYQFIVLILVQTEIIILLLSCRRFIVSPCKNGRHLGFYSQCNVQCTF